MEGLTNILEGIQEFHAQTIDDWRLWLEKNAITEKAVWLILYHKKSSTPCITYEQAVEHALCYGWIDSKAKKRNHESVYQKFTPRNPKSNWSPTNIVRANRMISMGLMTEPGMAQIEIAKKNGKWNN